MVQIIKGKKLAEGKTKIIWEIEGNPYEVLIESKDDITAGDGARHDVLPGKGIFSTTTICNCFRFLEQRGIKTHFIEQVDERSFRAHRVDMIPLEIVIRRIATGSYLKRNPSIKEGTKFESLVLEIFEKNDTLHDPLLIFDFLGKRVLSYDARYPLKDGFLEERFLKTFGHWANSLFITFNIPHIAKTIFHALEIAWERQGVVLVDLKIECGFDKSDGQVLVADVIDNDSWRIWPAGDKSKMKDKQTYRNSSSFNDVKKELRKNYKWVAEATKKFTR